MNYSKIKLYKLWLLCCIFLSLAIIGIGAYTRLSGSGLSITYWKPITGIVYPFDCKSWAYEFSLYKASPEYKLINFDMSLEEFKFIYSIEFFHRNLGRAIGLVSLLGYFFIEKNLLSNVSYWIILFLIGFQGLLGWIMVKSGLGAEATVSPLKLAIHLSFGVLIYLIFLHLLVLQSDYLKNCFKHKALINNKAYISREKFLLLLLFTQIFLGGLCSGAKARKVYPTWPMMGETFIPSEVLEYGVSFSDPIFLQFIHRISGYTLGLALIYLSPKRIFASILITIQIFLGVMTIKNDSMIYPLLHNFVGIAISSLIIIIYTNNACLK